MKQNQETKNENSSIDKFNINKDNVNPIEGGLFFYVMILQTENGEKHEIKIYENSNASELAFNFCKIHNLDFPTMKYLKKCIKQIIQQFQNNKNKGIVYFLKDNNSIQEVAEEEIITDNSLKKSGTIKKYNSNSSNNIQTNNTKIDEEKSINNQSKNNIQKINENMNNNINTNLDSKEEKNEKSKQEIKEENISLTDINKDQNDFNEFDIIKKKNSLEDDSHIEQKEYSIDYCLDDDSIELFSPTEHTTKIEQQQSSIRNNSSSLTKNNYYKYTFDKKKYSKDKKMQDNKNVNCNKTFNQLNYPSKYNKLKKEQNIITKKSIISELTFNYKKKKFLTKKNSLNNNHIRKKPQSVEKTLKKGNNRTPLLELSQNNRKSEEIKHNNFTYRNKYEKFMTNMNEMKKRFFSNYYNYFIKSNNISNPLSRNSITHIHQTSNSVNKENNKSKSISRNKISQNLTQKILNKSRIKKKKDKSIYNLNSLNPKNLNNTSKVNLNTVLNNNNYSKDKKKIIHKNKVKNNSIITYSNNTLFNKSKITYKKSSSSKRNNTSKELFKENKIKKNKNGIRKMVTNSLMNMHKVKDFQDNNKLHSLVTDRMTKEFQIKNKNNKNRDLFNKLFRNIPNIEKSNNINDKYFELKNKNNKGKKNLSKNKRNNTDINFVNKNNIKNENRGRLLIFKQI